MYICIVYNVWIFQCTFILTNILRANISCINISDISIYLLWTLLLYNFLLEKFKSNCLYIQKEENLLIGNLSLFPDMVYLLTNTILSLCFISDNSVPINFPSFLKYLLPWVFDFALDYLLPFIVFAQLSLELVFLVFHLYIVKWWYE